MSIATSITLVDKLRHCKDNETWSRFYELYSPLIVGFARQRGCDDTTAKDILQETMCQLLQYVKRFDYDPKRGQFRSYLLRIVMSRISKHMTKKLPTYPLNPLSDEPQLDIADPNSARPWNDFENIWRKNLMQHALRRVKTKVKPLTWRSFQCYVLQGKKSADDVARELSINKNSVYQHKNRIMELLKHEIKNLEYEIGDDENENYMVEKCDGETVKTLIEDNQYFGDLEQFQFLRQTLFKYTIPRQAYPQLLIVDSNKKKRGFKLIQEFSIGSRATNQLCLKSHYVSRNHCTVVKYNQEWVLKDLNSSNGVYINNLQIREKKLINGDIIQIGDRILIFLDGVQD